MGAGGWEGRGVRGRGAVRGWGSDRVGAGGVRDRVWCRGDVGVKSWGVRGISDFRL